MPAISNPGGRPDGGTGPLVTISSTVQKWRFKCPKYRHDDWRLWNGVYICRSCAKLRAAGQRDVDPVYSELWDDKENQTVPRERILIEV